MSLLVWLPLTTDTQNRGLSSPVITTTGTLSYDAGKIGNALTFNNSSIVLSPAPLNTNTKEFSFAFWFKPTSMTTYQCFYAGRNAVGSAIALWLAPENKWRFDCGSNTALNFGATLNEWHHFVFTRSESKTNFYVDGILKQTFNSTSFSVSATSATIGMDATLGTSGTYPITGQLNDYRIYDHALSKREVKELAKGLCMHLPLDWGGNPNMIKNSYTWMNKNLGSPNSPSTTRIYTRSIIEDEEAPCHWVYKCQIENAGTSSQGGCGCFYGVGAQGLALTDLVEGDTYTYSFWAKSDSGLSSGLDSAAIVETQTRVSYSGFGALDSNWRKHVVTFKWTKTTKLTACFYVTVPASSTIDFQVCGLKLEKGDKATPYIPHVDETTYTNNGYAIKYLQDCSGYNRMVTVNSNNIISVATDAPRGTGTNITKSGKLTIANSFPVGTFPSFTVNAWIRTKSDTTYTLWYDFFGISANNYAGSDSLFRMEVASTAGTSFNWFGPMQKNAGGLFNTSITAGQWCMVTLVSDGAKLYGYKDSVLYGTFTPEEAKLGWSTTGTFYIGDSNIWFDVADARIYATALSAEDVKELYQVSAQIDKSGNFYCGQLVEV